MSSQSKRIANWIPIVLIALTAIALRVFAIDRLPPGLFGDEAVEGLDALDVLAGNLGIWFHAHLGREPLYVYLTALSYRAFGVTPLATRLPALVAGLLTIPMTYLLVREWGSSLFPRGRAERLALLTTGLVAISFWHIQMTRNAHRDTLLPLVEAMGYWLLWRALHLRSWKAYAGAGLVLGLAVYTYSAGRFVGVFVAAFVALEFLLGRLGRQPVSSHSASRSGSGITIRWGGVILAGLLALLVMLPLGVYFAQNPAQFSRRFASVSIFDYPSPAQAFADSVRGNLAQFVVPGAGYQSKHYNLPGKPIFDLLIAPWFLAGLVIAVAQWKHMQFRFLLLWLVVMLIPVSLTADMIPKGVRVLGVVPGVFVFPALAMDAALERARATSTSQRTMGIVGGLIALSFLGSTIWTIKDYFVEWASLPELPLAFDADQTEVASFIDSLPSDRPVYLSQEVYRPPTLMLLGERIPTSRYVEPAKRFKESDARTTLIFGANQNDPPYIFVRDYAPSGEWRERAAPQAKMIARGSYFAAYQLGPFSVPQRKVETSFNPLLELVGVSTFADEPSGVMLYWRIATLPPNRTDIEVTLTLSDARGATVTQSHHRFGVPPLEWGVGDTIIEWYEIDPPDSAASFSVQLVRGPSTWQSAVLPLR